MVTSKRCSKESIQKYEIYRKEGGGGLLRTKKEGRNIQVITKKKNQRNQEAVK